MLALQTTAIVTLKSYVAMRNGIWVDTPVCGEVKFGGQGQYPFLTFCILTCQGPRSGSIIILYLFLVPSDILSFLPSTRTMRTGSKTGSNSCDAVTLS